MPAVNVDDLKRVWYAIQKITEHREATTDNNGAVGFDARLFEPYCTSGSDVKAVALRALLLRALLQAGQLDDVRKGSDLHDSVFDAAAIFPMERGVERLDLQDFIDHLRR